MQPPSQWTSSVATSKWKKTIFKSDAHGEINTTSPRGDGKVSLAIMPPCRPTPWIFEIGQSLSGKPTYWVQICLTYCRFLGRYPHDRPTPTRLREPLFLCSTGSSFECSINLPGAHRVRVQKGFTNFLQEFSIPLIVGVLAGIVYANVDYDTYHKMVDYHIGGAVPLGHKVTVHYLINDIFMVFFFGIAAKEITESVLPGGDLNPPSKAINPLLGTLGGVFGPVGVYLLLTNVLYSGEQASQVATGWGIPTATDIALAWLVARVVFGNKHPAVSFLLLWPLPTTRLDWASLPWPTPNTTRTSCSFCTGPFLECSSPTACARRA